MLSCFLASLLPCCYLFTCFLAFLFSFFLSCFLAFLLSCFLAFLLSCFLTSLLLLANLLTCFLAFLFSWFVSFLLPCSLLLLAYFLSCFLAILPSCFLALSLSSFLNDSKLFSDPKFSLPQKFFNHFFPDQIFFQIQVFLPSLASTPTQVGTALTLTHPQNK